MAKTPAQRQREFVKRQSIRGKVLKRIWVRPKTWPVIEALIAKLESK